MLTYHNTRIMEIALIIICIGISISFLHWCMGSPSGEEYDKGRIFSLWGRFVTSQYKEFERKESARLRAKFEDWKHDADSGFIVAVRGASPVEANRITQVHLDECKRVETQIEKQKRLNFWKSLGACLLCFATWAALINWSVMWVAFGFNPIWILLGTPVSVWVALRAEF